MNNLSGGYIMVDLSSPNKVKQLEKAAALNKPLLVYYQDGTTEWGKVTVTYETVDDVEVPTYHITTANGFVTVEADGDVSTRPLLLDGDINTSVISGVEFTYAKWSLSGTHLMIVLAGSIENGTAVSRKTLGKIYLPNYILNKISPWQNNLIEFKSISYLSASLTLQYANTDLLKNDDNVEIVTNPITASDDRNFRIQFDLLIDNE